MYIGSILPSLCFFFGGLIWCNVPSIFFNFSQYCISSRKLYIADARPRKNALANGAMGGGSESSSNYFQSEVCKGPDCPFLFFVFTVINLTLFLSFKILNLYHQVVFFGIDNIHAMRESFVRLREYMDTHGRASSDGMLSFLVSL